MEFKFLFDWRAFLALGGAVVASIMAARIDKEDCKEILSDMVGGLKAKLGLNKSDNKVIN